jgi:ribosomal protein S18 acetylase RimI-like enzyme
VDAVRLQPAQLDAACQTLAAAFQEDPAWGWVLPDARRRATLLPWLFRIGFDVTDAEVWTTPGRVLGCARWLPPGRPEVRVIPMLRALVATPLRLREATSRFLAYGRAVEAMRSETVPGEHWYLAGIGVDPSSQRQGIGGSLLAPGLAAADRDGIPAALLTNSERNLSFYAEHGFEVIHEGETPEGGPHAWMLRRLPQ